MTDRAPDSPPERAPGKAREPRKDANKDATKAGTAGAAHRIRVAALKSNRTTAFDLRPDPETCAAIAQTLGIKGLRKARLAGDLAPHGRNGWRLNAYMGATVTQECVVTLDPVVTRIEEEIERTYMPEDQLDRPATGPEIEVPDDDSEPLPEVIDLREVLTEALSLALPPYPRSENAPPPESLPDPADLHQDTEDDARPNPFAGLAGLRDKLADDENGGS